MTEASAPSPGRKRMMLIALLLFAGTVVAALLFMRGCHPAPPPVAQALPFDYFRAKDEELHNDPAAIIAFVRDTMPTLDYRGNVKGALGALWNGAASADEKQLLAEALLAAASAPRSVTLDEIAPNRDKAKDSVSPLKLTIVHRIETANAPQDTTIYDGPAGDLIGDVHSVEMLADGKRRITLRYKGSTATDLAVPADAAGEDLIFTWQLPDQPANAPALSTTRELWHRGNRTGASAANAGDRHDFVVIPCRIGAYVRQKEPVILQQRGRAQAPEASAYLGLLDYALESDEHLTGIEKRLNVTARFDAPRVLMLSRFVAPDLPGGTAFAIDLTINSAGFSGDRVAAYRATQVRSFMESSLENQFLQNFSGLPATAAFDVFTILQDEYPETSGGRIAQIRLALLALQQEKSTANSATFSLRPGSRPNDAPMPTVQATWSPDGIEIHGRPIRKQLAARLAENKDGVWLPASGSGTFKNIDDAAVAVETGLLAADVTPPVPLNYSLAVNIDQAAMSLVQPQARFTLQWTQDNAPTEQQDRILNFDDGLSYQWRVQAGVLPVAGTRKVTATALTDATTHNPWYRAGDSTQTGESSFVFSRKVYQAIKSGHGVDITMLANLPPKADPTSPRPIDFTATLTPVGPDTITPMVNGRAEKIAILRCTLRGQPMSILDDPAYPVGMAEDIHSIVTVVRGKLLDEANKPVCGAVVRVVNKDLPEESVTSGATSPDGIFALPPADAADDYGKVTLQVVFNDGSTQNVVANLATPGLSIVPIHVLRPRAKLLYLTRVDKRALDALDLSDEVKRQAQRQLDAGRMVVIPGKYVTDGWNNFIAFYACDAATGEYVGITEDGLCGASNLRLAMPAATQPITSAPSDATSQPATQPAATEFAATEPATNPSTAASTTQEAQTQPELPPLTEAEVPSPSAADEMPRALRNAAIVFHACQDYFPSNISHNEAALQTLQAMQTWAASTDIAGIFAAVPDAQISAKLQALLKARTIPPVAAKAMIQLGYVGATQYLTTLSEAKDAQ